MNDASASNRFAYDDVPYDSEANADTHPATMATIAHLCGLVAAAPATCRVLEIGCGNAENILAAATYLPKAHFVGFDFAEEAIARGLVAARLAGLRNVDLFHGDIREVRKVGVRAYERGAFDYVVAHGIYSWVPEPLRDDTLAIMRDALAPGGLGFLSINALPGWELRRAIRDLALHATDRSAAPEIQVRDTLALVEELAALPTGTAAFTAVLAAAAKEYRAHVADATPPDAPFARYVFHDLLAECNAPFSLTDLDARLRRAGLRVVCEAPLRRGRLDDFASAPRDAKSSALATHLQGLAADMAFEGTPFLQVLVQRDDGAQPSAPTADRLAGLALWSDLTKVDGRHDGPATYRTTTNALVRPTGGDGLARAAKTPHAFVAIDALSDDDLSRARVARELFEGVCAGFIVVTSEPPPVAYSRPRRPRVAGHVRARAAAAVDRSAESCVLTNALHRSFHVPWGVLAIVREFDGESDIDAISARVKITVDGVAHRLAGPLAGASSATIGKEVVNIVDRFMRHAFLLTEDATDTPDPTSTTEVIE